MTMTHDTQHIRFLAGIHGVDVGSPGRPARGESPSAKFDRWKRAERGPR